MKVNPHLMCHLRKPVHEVVPNESKGAFKGSEFRGGKGERDFKETGHLRVTYTIYNHSHTCETTLLNLCGEKWNQKAK